MSLKAVFYPDIPFESLYLSSMFKQIYMDRIYENIGIDRSSIVVDLGAYIGLVTHYFREQVKRVYSIEPAKSTFEALKRNKEFNKWDNVSIFNVAIADKDGEMILHHHPNNQSAFSLIEKPSDEGEIVSTMRLDTFFNINNIKKVDFMKVDVEGAEGLIFKSEGFRNVADRIKNMIVEIHRPHKRTETFKQLISDIRAGHFKFKGWKAKWTALFSHK